MDQSGKLRPDRRSGRLLPWARLQAPQQRAGGLPRLPHVRCSSARSTVEARSARFELLFAMRARKGSGEHKLAGTLLEKLGRRPSGSDDRDRLADSPSAAHARSSGGDRRSAPERDPTRTRRTGRARPRTPGEDRVGSTKLIRPTHGNTNHTNGADAPRRGQDPCPRGGPPVERSFAELGERRGFGHRHRVPASSTTARQVPRAWRPRQATGHRGVRLKTESTSEFGLTALPDTGRTMTSGSRRSAMALPRTQWHQGARS